MEVHWVDRDRRLPEHRETVLLCIQEIGEIWTGYWNEIEGRFENDLDNRPIPGITHWLEGLIPPQEGE